MIGTITNINKIEANKFNAVFDISVYTPEVGQYIEYNDSYWRIDRYYLNDNYWRIYVDRPFGYEIPIGTSFNVYNYPPVFVKDNDKIKPVCEMYIKDSGVLKKIRGMYKKENEQLKGKMFKDS